MRFTHLAANDDVGMPETVLHAPDDAILFLRSGNVSMTKSRNSKRAPTSFCSSWKGREKKKKKGNLRTVGRETRAFDSPVMT